MHSVEKKIILCGFMGAGKSSFLNKLKDHKEFAFYDLDEEILKNHKKYQNLGQLIENLGWEAFRQLEYDLLLELMGHSGNMVIALGGGAFNEKNQILVKNAITIWLDTPLPLCLERIKGTNERPLLKLSQDELHSLYQKRVSQYAKCNIVLKPNQIDQITNMADLFSHIGLT